MLIPRKVINQYKLKQSKLIIACSGGSDSMCLLHNIQQIVPKNQIIVAHINHQLRKTAKRDEDFVKQYANKHKLEFITKKIALNSQKNLESEARKLRYKALQEIKADYNADYILTGHHQDDQIETILLNWLRGTKLRGLIGIYEQQRNTNVLRPLLTVPKSKILEQIKEANLSYCEDETNQDLKHKRNEIRHVEIPKLAKIWPNYKKEIIQLSSFALKWTINQTAILVDLIANLEIKQKQETLTIANISDAANLALIITNAFELPRRTTAIQNLTNILSRTNKGNFYVNKNFRIQSGKILQLYEVPISSF